MNETGGQLSGRERAVLDFLLPRPATRSDFADRFVFGGRRMWRCVRHLERGGFVVWDGECYRLTWTGEQEAVEL